MSDNFSKSRSRTTLTLLGAALGLTWAAALRGFMVEVAGALTSTVDWTGTFLLILAPGAIVGALLGWAEHLRRTGGRRGWRWIALAPLLFPIAALSAPGALALFLSTGLGGGALGVALLGMLAGYALSGRGPIGARLIAGIVALLTIPAYVVGTLAAGVLSVTTPRGAWVAVLFFGLIFVLSLGASIPHRAVTKPAAA